MFFLFSFFFISSSHTILWPLVSSVPLAVRSLFGFYISIFHLVFHTASYWNLCDSTRGRKKTQNKTKPPPTTTITKKFFIRFRCNSNKQRYKLYVLLLIFIRIWKAPCYYISMFELGLSPSSVWFGLGWYNMCILFMSD